MSLRASFAGKTIILGLLLLIGSGIFAYKTYAPTHRYEDAPVTTEDGDITPPTFAWVFAEDHSLNPDGFPQTTVSLVATYPDGSVKDRLIDIVPGGCSILPDPEEGSLHGSSAVQCYYAGLGYRYRVVTGDTSYLVERKTFEEASPDYEPPQQEYETISEFPN